MDQTQLVRHMLICKKEVASIKGSIGDGFKRIEGWIKTRPEHETRCPGTLLLDHETSRDLGPVLSRDVSCPCLIKTIVTFGVGTVTVGLGTVRFPVDCGFATCSANTSASIVSLQSHGLRCRNKQGNDGLHCCNKQGNEG